MSVSLPFSVKSVLLSAAVAALALTGCDEKKSDAASAGTPGSPSAAGPAKSGETAGAKPAEPSGTQVADLPVTVELPAGAVANEGGPGFHAEDESVYVLIKEAADTDPQTFDAAKKSAEEFGFKKWVKSAKAADGWALAWNGAGIDMSGNEYVNTSFSVRKKVGEKNYDCYGSVKKAEYLEKNLKLCQSLKAAQ